jgi:two-component system, chemotaxis family, chemotaxis protein CheY
MSKLLVVDDSSAMRKIILRVLRQADLDFDDFLEAQSGVEALRMLASDHAIALVLSDLDMPGMDGVALVEAVRARHAKELLPVILVANESDVEAMELALAAGANACVCKPFTPESIRRALRPHVGSGSTR